MIYHSFGAGEPGISALGFGCMRLPMRGEGKNARVDDELVGPMLRRAYENGVNYFDTAYGYCNLDSQRAVGKAVKSFRDRIYLSTKLPLWEVKKPDDFWRLLDDALVKLDTDHIDFYHFHSVNRSHWENIILPFKLIDLAEQAKARGYIRRLSFSFHDKEDLMREMIDTGAFSSLLCQYNLIDRSNEGGMAYAHEHGMGVFVMGPVGGGNIALGGPDFLRKFHTQARSAVELAFRFVLGNPAVTCALSGMENLAMVDDNLEYVSRAGTVTAEEWSAMAKATDELEALSRRYCSGCDYCDVCPKGIKPSVVFRMYNNWKVWGLEEMARRRFAELGKREDGPQHPDLCISCGACRRKCPQRLDIPAELRKMTAELKTL